MPAPVVNQAPASESATPGTQVPPFTSNVAKASMRIQYIAFFCLAAGLRPPLYDFYVAHHLQCAFATQGFDL